MNYLSLQFQLNFLCKYNLIKKNSAKLAKTIGMRNRLLKIYTIIVIIALAIPQAMQAKMPVGRYVSGIVRDANTGEPMPYASIIVKETKRSTVTNEKGIFEIPINSKARTLMVSCVGYEKKEVPLSSGVQNLFDISLTPSVSELQEVVVHRKKYCKKDNPAVKFARLLRNTSGINDPLNEPFYSYDKYEKIVLALNEADSASLNSGLNKHMKALKNHVDTSEVTGKPVVPVSLKEKSSHVNYRKSPGSTKETVTGFNHEGLDDFADQESFQTFLEDVFREVNLYQNDIPLFQYRFVSPLSPIATDFYKFYLTDSLEIDGEKCIVLSCYPMNKATFGFIGHIYVADNDSTMFIKRVEFKVPKEINLNFIESLYVIQEYKRGENGRRLKTLDDLTAEMRVLPGTPGVYVRRSTRYGNHSFDRPADLAIFDRDENRHIVSDAEQRDSLYWQEKRLVGLTRSESTVSKLQEELRKSKFYYITEKFLKIMCLGYVQLGSNSKFDIGPVNTMVSWNDIEGTRFRLGGTTTANLSKRFFFKGYGAWGTKDHRWKYSAELDWSLIDKKDNPRQFPVRGFKLSHTYDIDHLGQHYNFSNPDNVFLSLKRLDDHLAIYHHLTALNFTWETAQNFKVSLTLDRRRRDPSPWVGFTDGNGHTYNHLDQCSAKLELRYAPGEKFYQTRSARVLVNFDAPTFLLTHTFAPKSLATGSFGVNRTELGFTKRFWLSAAGYVDFQVGAAHEWGNANFLDLLTPNANLSYTIQPESYAMLNPMEFMLDSYVNWDVTYWLNGLIFNYIPYFNKLKLREVVSFKGVWGRLSDKNNPALHPELLRFPAGVNELGMHKGPYMEISAGVDNILKCIRLDYVWRLSYLNVPYKIDRHGLRLALHFTF